MKDILNMAARLCLICAVAALALAQVDGVTREPIAAAEAQAQRLAVEAVLPAFAQLAVDTLAVADGQPEAIYYTGFTEDGELTGTAFTSSTVLGYSGFMKIMMGVGTNGNVIGVRVLQHAETPGLGSNYTAPELLKEFYEDRPLDGEWLIKKDGGTVDAITGATVTGRAITDAIATGAKQYLTDKDKLSTTAPPPPPATEEIQ